VSAPTLNVNNKNENGSAITFIGDGTLDATSATVNATGSMAGIEGQSSD